MIKNKEATIYPENNYDKYSQYAIAVALNHERNRSHPERISKLRLS